MTFDTTRPAYRVLDPNGFFGPDDTLYQFDEYGEPVTIYFDGEPNEQLEPVNEPARVKLNAYLERLDEAAKTAAEKLGRPFVGRPRNIDGAIELATALQRDSMQIMGVRKESATIEKVNTGPIPETGRRGRGRPRKNSGPVTIASAA